MKNSTKAMFKKHGWRVDKFIHNYLYFLFYYQYIRIINLFLPLLKHLKNFKPIVFIGKMIFNRYHAKVLSFGDTKKVFSLNKDIRVISEKNKQIIPFKYATKIIFQEPTHIAVMDCPCKKSTHAPSEDINSCIAVGKDLSNFWIDHCQKYNARKITQIEALDIITQFRKKGHITQAFFKVATGGSTGVICNCHPKTCVSLRATITAKEIDKSLSQSAPSGYSIIFDASKCISCESCSKVCIFGAVKFKDGIRLYDKNECMGCELCIENCHKKAIELYIDKDKPLPLDLDKV
ncbi:MAG: 4Fe-4S binding protein [Desulfobacterales bacterium]|nr:4Fe-4S binding protein [Desulfobacterales bacterium]